MQEFRYVPVNGHAVAQVNGGSYLLDTGLPRSMARQSLSFAGRDIAVEREVLGLTVADLSAAVGAPLDGVLGANLFEQFEVGIDPHKHTVGLDIGPVDYPLQLAVENLAGIAQVTLGVAGRKTRGLLELGMGVSLVHPNLVRDLEPAGRCRELFGYIGEREMDVYWVPVTLGDQLLHLRFGAMPPEVSTWLELANVEATLGYEVLDHYALHLSMSQGTLGLKPLH